MAQLLSMTQQQLDSNAQEQLQPIEQSAKPGAAMVKRILTLTRGSSEEAAAMAVWPVVEEVITMVQRSFPKTIAVTLAPFPSRCIGMGSCSPFLPVSWWGGWAAARRG